MPGELFTGANASEWSSVVTAIWAMERIDENLCLHVGHICKFIKHTIKIINSDSREKEIQHVFVK